jgi:hypothetical protein
VINPEALLLDLKKLLAQLEGDLRERADEVPTLGESLRSEYQRAMQAERTAQPFETWREEYLTQAAVAWVLGCVFVRFAEDNGMIDTPLLAGSGASLGRAKDQRTLYFQQHPTDSDREYLYYVFRKVEALPAAAPLFDERHNPLWAFGVSGDGATLLIEFWQRIDPATGVLAHLFSDPALNTRFLGDLYQDLSEAARKKYALLQTPDFVEEFILDRTLTPAIAEFGLAEVRLIDPACGSGHFLLGAFHRLLHEWLRREPIVNVRELTQRALDAVYGVDLNPYAVAIARFRLLIAALKASGVNRLADAPGFRINLAVGDSLLHGPRPELAGARQMYLESSADPLRHVYDTEDSEELRRILGGQYHVVVGNPPYITVEDKALNAGYRERFGSCYGQYSLAVPFMERMFDLGINKPEDVHHHSTSAYIGFITSNSFTKREFGKRLIEQYIPKWDITHVVDTMAAGPSLRGHGTPTIVMFGRHRAPVLKTIRTVMGIQSESQGGGDNGYGEGWKAIVDQIDNSGSVSKYVSVADIPRDNFRKHPWSLGGGGAAELKELLDSSASATLASIGADIGFQVISGEDNCLMVPIQVAERLGLRARTICIGEAIRDWVSQSDSAVLWPNTPDGDRLSESQLESHLKFLWPFRTTLKGRKAFGTPIEEKGIPWWALREVYPARLKTELSIAFAFVATHNHFVFDKTGAVFNRSAPVIKLSTGASSDDYLSLLGLLNSSIGCFWMKQTFFNKGAGGIGGGIGDEAWEPRYEFDVTKMKAFPLPSGRPLRLTTEINARAAEFTAAAENALLRSTPAPGVLAEAAETSKRLTELMIGIQEELDWECYKLYGLFGEDTCCETSETQPLALGQRAFEIVLARRIAREGIRTSWFERHRSTPITELPADWSAQYRAIVERRIAAIETDTHISLVERPEFKRRWNSEPWTEQISCTLRNWLLVRLETIADWSDQSLTTVSKIADRCRRDEHFMQVAELYRGRSDFDVTALVEELVKSDAVPFLPVLRLRPSGVRKRAAWEETWELQRREDIAEDVNEIPVPPKYTAADFLEFSFWSLRGKLDVPKERFISYPHAEREGDRTLVIGWAGWDHLQQAKALAAYYVDMKDREGWTRARLQPLLAGLLELIPWLKQWHNAPDPSFGIGMGDYFAGFVDEEARALELTVNDVRKWQPATTSTHHRRRASV